MGGESRNLYRCMNAKCNGEIIWCDKGHKLGRTGTRGYRELVRGEPLTCNACRKCPDYTGEPPVPKDERGWIKMLQEQTQ